jgi:hypothetical protein
MSKYFLIFCLVICSVSYIYADTAVLEPVADSPLFELQSGTNYGSQIYGYWGYYNGGQRTLILYDLSGISGIVTGAQLSWEYYLNTGSGADMWSCVVTGGSWDEYTATWNNQPAHDDSESGRLLDIPWDTSSGIVTYGCTAYAISIIQDWVDNPSTNYGMLLKKSPESGNLPRCYPYMRESAYQPVQLIVEYVPTALERRTFGQIKALFQ